MNKRAFTLVELIAVVVIMSIIALIATPNIVKMSTNSKKEQYATDVKDFTTKARYMYKLEKYKSNTHYFTNEGNGYKILLQSIKNVDEDDLNDPYGCVYDKTNSYILITDIENNDAGGGSDQTVTLPTVRYIIRVVSTCANPEEKHCIITGDNGLTDINMLDANYVTDSDCS